MGKFNHGLRYKTSGTLGFTLVELLVVLIILGGLISIVFITLNPFAQIQKGNDAKRQSDLEQISNALDTYNNDNSHYPNSLDDLVNQDNGNYMQEVPRDPISNTDSPYTYVVDTVTNNPPQWYVVFGKMENKPSNKSFCALENISNSSCLPTDYASLGYNLCKYAGDVDCATLHTQSIANFQP